MAEKEERSTSPVQRMAEKSMLLQILDQHWKDHLLALDHLRQGIGLRAYAQRDPLNEYKREAFEMFEAMLNRLREEITTVLTHIEVRMRRPAARAAAAAAAATHRANSAPQPPAGDGRGRRRRRRPAGRARTIPTGARSRATPPAPAAPARSSSTATAGIEPSSGYRQSWFRADRGQPARRRQPRRGLLVQALAAHGEELLAPLGAQPCAVMAA